MPPLGGRDLYRAALSQMQQIVQPPYLTYRTVVPAGDGDMVVSRDDEGRAELAVVAGQSETQSWEVAYRTWDGVASVKISEDQRAISRLAMFDPTWRGAFTWLRHGIGASISMPVATPGPQPTADGEEPPLVAVVTAINETSYDIRDGGGEACPNGKPGHRIWAQARNDALAHPMTGAIIDDATRRFCSMRFHEHTFNGAITFDLDIDLHFGQVERYYLITGGTLEGAVRPYKRPGWFTMKSSFFYDRFSFPSSLPDGLFVGTGVPESRGSGASDGNAISL